MVLPELRDAGPACGGKAQHLARLIAAGLDVPPGFAIPHDAFPWPASVELDAIGQALHALEHVVIPEALEREVIARAAALGGSLAVRSSATIEDGAAGAAAGVFSSRTAVDPRDVWPAIRAVWASALTPLAAAYARRRGGAIAIGVVVQRFVDGERVVVYTRPPGRPGAEEVVVQRGERVEHARRVGERSAASSADAAARVEIVEAALAAERAIGAPGGADVELVIGERTWVVQARPIVHPVAVERVAAPDIVLAPLRDGRVWTWDVTHNPEPLSVAQQNLVERVAHLGRYELRLAGGYLYATPRDLPPIDPPRDVPALDAIATKLEGEMSAALAGAASLADAIARYVAFYRPWAELNAVIGAVRRPIEARAVAPAHRPSAVEATLLRAARSEISDDDAIAELGAMSPAWDVAVPTYAERPAMIRDAIARLRASPAPAPSAPSPDALYDRAVDLAERDDAWFARAQAMVRHAIRATAAGIDPDDAFWLSLDELARVDAVQARAIAAANRAAAERAGRWAMPIVVGRAAPPAGKSLHGVGTGPRVVGRVVRFASLASAISVGRGDVVVTRAVTPALAVFIAGCAAIVSETGGLLDHGAALARELGIPCVVGCTDAWSQLLDGTTVLVDGTAGTVTKL